MTMTNNKKKWGQNWGEGVMRRLLSLKRWRLRQTCYSGVKREWEGRWYGKRMADNHWQTEIISKIWILYVELQNTAILVQKFMQQSLNHGKVQLYENWGLGISNRPNYQSEITATKYGVMAVISFSKPDSISFSSHNKRKLSTTMNCRLHTLYTVY